MIKRYLILVFVTMIMNSIFSQNDLSGKYWTMSCGFTHGYFLRLFPDSIAHFAPIFVYADSYMEGTWRTLNDTLIVTLNDSIENTKIYEYFLIKDSLHLYKINQVYSILSNDLYRQEAYFPNGDIKYKIEYGYEGDSEYQFDGRIYYYYPGKRIKQIIDYKDGLRHGIEMNFTWYGYAKSYGTWKNNQKNGTWYFYDPDFNQVSQAKYKKGRLKYGRENGSACFPSWDMDIYKKLYLNK